MTNGERIKNIIKSKGLKIGWVAEQTGITRTALHRVFKGQTSLKAEQIYALSKLLDISSDVLLGLKDDPSLEEPS